MLILSLVPGESFMIGDDVTVTVLENTGRQIRLGLKAPKAVKIYLEEEYHSERNRGPCFSTHKGRLEALYRTERDLGPTVADGVTILANATAETMKVAQSLAEYLRKAAQPNGCQPSHKSARPVLEVLKYLRYSVRGRILALTEYRSKAAALVDPIAEVARLYDVQSHKERLQRIFHRQQELGRAVDAAIGLLRDADAEADQEIDWLERLPANLGPYDLPESTLRFSRLLEVMHALPEGLQMQAAALSSAAGSPDATPTARP